MVGVCEKMMLQYRRTTTVRFLFVWKTQTNKQNPHLSSQGPVYLRCEGMNHFVSGH